MTREDWLATGPWCTSTRTIVPFKHLYLELRLLEHVLLSFFLPIVLAAIPLNANLTFPSALTRCPSIFATASFRAAFPPLLNPHPHPINFPSLHVPHRLAYHEHDVTLSSMIIINHAAFHLRSKATPVCGAGRELL